MIPRETRVKPGDELALGYRIVQVDHVTLTGQIVLTNGKRYDRTGRVIGIGWSIRRGHMMTPELSPITDELRAEIARQEARPSNIAYLENLDWWKFDNTILEQVVATLKKAKQYDLPDVSG